MGKAQRYACIARVYRGELPYLYPFVRHYLNLGFSRVYLVLQAEQLASRISAGLRELSSCVAYIFVPSTASPDDVLVDLASCVCSCVEEDYLLHVDCDEFLRIPYSWTIGEYVAHAGFPDHMIFQWVMVCADVDPAFQLRRGFYGCNSKQMARTDRILQFATPHRFSLKADLQSLEVFGLASTGSGADGAFLVHFWSRSFNDILIRCLHGGNHGGPRACSHDDLLKHIAGSTLPGRLKILASFMMHDRYYLVDNYLKEGVDLGLEESLISPWLSAQQRERLLELYVDYRKSLDVDSHVAPFPVNHKINAAWLSTLP